MTQLRMSLLGSGPGSFEPARPAPISSPAFHPPRPVLKRARTPYRSAAEHKRRRTSPTGAFSRLSLSPTSDRRPAAASARAEPVRKPSPAAPPETKMRSVYSAYEIGPDRVFIESLSDGPSSPAGSADEEPQKLFELDKKLAAQLDAHHHALALSSSNSLAPATTPSPETQLVLYRKPSWPITPPPVEQPLEIEEAQMVKIDNHLDGDLVVEMEELDSPAGGGVHDSMEID